MYTLYSLIIYHSNKWGPVIQLDLFLFVSVPYILGVGELRGNMAFVGRRKNYPWYIWYTSYFFRNKTFLFVKTESWNFQHLFNLGFCESLQNFNPFRQHFSKGHKSCLNELKFCEVPRNNKSKRCWKIHISILTNKKVLFIKNGNLLP